MRFPHRAAGSTDCDRPQGAVPAPHSDSVDCAIEPPGGWTARAPLLWLAALFGVAALLALAGCGENAARPPGAGDVLGADGGASPGGAARDGSAHGGGGAGPAIGAPATAAPATGAGADPIPPDLLTLKAREWAAEMDGPMTRRAARAGTGAAGASTGTGDPGGAGFVDPEDFRIGPRQVGAGAAAAARPAPRPEAPPTVYPLGTPTVESTPSNANQAASIAGAEARPGEHQRERAAAGDASGGRGGALGTPVASAGLPKFIQDFPPGPAAGGPDPVTGARTHPRGAEPAPEANLRAHPKDLWAHLDYQLALFLQDQSVPRLDVMSRLGAEDREVLGIFLDGLSMFRNAVRADGNMLVSRKVKPLLDMADRLRAQADLVIPTVALCRRVDAFGAYDPIEPARFVAMREHPVIVYCEVENFASQLNDKNLWETRLSQELVLYTETGLPVWQDKTQVIPDVSRKRRHDFFVVKKTRFPANITIGRYLLKVTIVDQQSNRVAEANAPVQFVAQ